MSMFNRSELQQTADSALGDLGRAVYAAHFPEHAAPEHKVALIIGCMVITGAIPMDGLSEAQVDQLDAIFRLEFPAEAAAQEEAQQAEEQFAEQLLQQLGGQIEPIMVEETADGEGLIIHPRGATPS